MENSRETGFRKMTIDDYDGIYDLWLHTQGMGLNDLDDSKEGIRKFLKRNPETCFVAEDGGVIVGVLIGGHDGRRGYIYHTAVALSHRKQGIGNELVRLAMKALEQEGINKAALVVFERNELGNAFWEKQGFDVRNDLIYRNKGIRDMTRIDT
ncbi:MAG: GNAT family N-acetyltransferase [Lacrimispora sp.]